MEVVEFNTTICPTSTTTIYDLNDYVIRETFKNLNDLQLCAVADVCTNFKQNAQAVFSTRYKAKQFILSIRDNRKFGYFMEKEIQNSKFLMRKLGFFIKFLVLHCGFEGDFQTLRKRSKIGFELINEFCGDTISSLDLLGPMLTNDFVSIMRPVLSRLRNTFISECMMEPHFILLRT